MSVVSEYFDYHSKYSEIYGDNTVIMIQIGSFFEFYSVQSDKVQLGPNIQEIGNLLNIQVTRKNKNLECSKRNPVMAGIPLNSLQKYLPLLTDNNYTVVLVEQITNPPKCQRAVTKIYSPGTIFTDSKDSNGICSIYIEELKNGSYLVGACSIDLSLGTCKVFETGGDLTFILDSLLFFIKAFPISECIIYTNGKINNLIEILELDNTLVHNKNFKDLKDFLLVSFQNTFLEKLYKLETLITPIEFLGLEMHSSCIVALLIVADFIFGCNESILEFLKYPEIVNLENSVAIMNNGFFQLDLFSNKKRSNKFCSVFDVVNKTITILGKRKLKEYLLFPLKCTTELNRRYSLIDSVNQIEKKLETITGYLKKIVDLQKYFRKIQLLNCSIYEFYSVVESFKCALDIYKITNEKVDIELDIDKIQSFIEYYNTVFDFNSGIIRTGINVELDSTNSQIQTLKQKLNEIANRLSVFLDGTELKVIFNDLQGYYISTTNIRANVIKKAVGDQFDFISNKSGTKIVNKEINSISNKLIVLEKNFEEQFKVFCNQILSECNSKYNGLFTIVSEFIGVIDLTISNYKVSKMYNFVKPTISENSEESFLDIKGIRHPLVERIRESVAYVKNDVSLGNESLILFGQNNSGKSTCIKSVGIAVLLAQSGMFVPCDSMTYFPFSKIIPRINGGDNILKSQSSFVAEILELKMILRNADGNTLVLMDELCCSTEQTSACSLVSSTVLYLSSVNCPFILVTHIHWLSTCSQIKKLENVKIKHFSVSVDKGTIIFNRKLIDGSGPDIYGLEIAKTLGLPDSFIQNSFEIRNELVKKGNGIIDKKKSIYNSKKNVSYCQICDFVPKKGDIPLDVHHIVFQCLADTNGFIEGVGNKNVLNNLVSLCKNCHVSVHNGTITINGYIETSKGIVLDFFKN